MIYIYIGRFFCNFIFRLTESGRVRVQARFLPKPKLDPDPVRVLFLNPNPTLFFIGPGRVPQVRQELSSLHTHTHTHIYIYMTL